MLVPKAWTADVQDSKATITTGHGETFTLTIEDNPKELPVLDWYLAAHPEIKASQLLKYRSKHGYAGIIGADLLTTYIPWGSKIFVFHYDLDGQTFINYRTTYYMMLNSLELKGLPTINVPAGSASLPFEPSATSTGVVNQPTTVEAPATNPAPTSTESRLVP
jgi:hypothetical protein